MKITTLYARTVLDSRGNPTVEVEASCRAGSVAAIVPSGASTGTYEAKELRDGGKAWRGMGVDAAVKNVNTVIAKALVRKEFAGQANLDAALLRLDGTDDKSRLGANAILGVSMAYARLSALDAGLPLWQHLSRAYKTKPQLPVIFANVLNGGRHADNGLAVQECMIAPKRSSFPKAVEDVANTYHSLKAVIAKRYGGAATGVGDEGGFAPPVRTAADALELLEQASKDAGTKVRFALDAAASEFYDAKAKVYRTPTVLTSGKLAAYWEGLVKAYGVRSLEDPFTESAFDDFAMLRERLKARRLRCQIVGDDLTVTNPKRIRQAVETKSCDCLLLKVNQIGTVTEAVAAARAAQAAGWQVMVSHRSGETDDSFISHLVVGLGTGQAKIGAPCRGERTAKYNELLRISESVRPVSNW